MIATISPSLDSTQISPETTRGMKIINSLFSRLHNF